jgi:hypothetical protein
MAKPTFADFSTTPADNTDINSIGIQGTNAVQNFDNAFRELMAILRRDVPGLSLANSFTGIGTYTKIQKWAKGADVASATSLSLGDDGNYFDITGTTAITSIATKGVGTVVKLHFDAGLTLTHNATDLILPGGANIVTAAGDEAEFVEYAAGDWRCTNYSRASDNWVDVASATTTDIGAVASQNVRVTGTTTITGLGTVAAGTFRRVRFAGILTLTHNGTSLILPGAANITTAAGDVFEFISEGSGNWRCVDYTLAAGDAYTKKYTSANIAITLAGSGTLTHGLGGIPDAVFVDFVCLTGEGGYTAGEVMAYNVHGMYDGATNRGVALAKTSTSIKYKFSSNALQALRLDNGNNFTITPANWEMVVRAAR